jgi:hypothetical protein
VWPLRLPPPVRRCKHLGRARRIERLDAVVHDHDDAHGPDIADPAVPGWQKINDLWHGCQARIACTLRP